MVIVLTNSGDATADYLCNKFPQFGIRFLRINTDLDFSSNRCEVSANEVEIIIDGVRIAPDQVSHVWFRRPCPLSSESGFDAEERHHSAKEWTEALEGFLAHIPTQKWINHPAFNALASHKIEQLSRAARHRLSCPKTIVTQSPDRLLKFWEQCSGKVIVKPLASGFLERKDSKNDSQIYTNQVSKEHLRDTEFVRACPTLFQEMIEKSYDVRVCVLDDHLHASALNSKDENGVQLLDIRRNNMVGVRYSTVEMPPELEKAVFELIRSYQLRFAALDFAVDNNGDWKFFEINPNGQWAWLDISGGSDIAAFFIETLRS